MENLASRLKESIMQLVDDINNKPELVTSLCSLVAKSGFDWSFMEAIIRGLKEEWLMDKAIQVMVDTWNEYANRNDERCYKSGGSYTVYDGDQRGIYSVERPLYKTLKYSFLERDLKSVKAGELERRKVNAKFEKKIQEISNSRSDNTGKPRRLVDVETATHSFIISYPNKISEKTKANRLSVFYSDLARNGMYIDAETSPDVFYKKFTGIHTGEKIVWTADYKQLLYLIKTLHDAGVLSWNTEKPKPRIRQMICIVFQIRDFEYKEVEGKLEKTAVPTIHKIEISNLNTTIDNKDEGLDPIIRRLLFGEESTQTVSEAVSDIFNEEGEIR